MPGDDTTGEGFRGLVLQLRGRTGLTQRELAAQLGVHVHTIQGWEAGSNTPGVASLKALIAAGVRAGGFTTGHETEEARTLWAAALRDAPRFRMPFDDAWFERIAADQHDPVRDDTEVTVAAPPEPHMATRSARRESWGGAPDVLDFVGRVGEREVLGQWASDERYRVIAVLGLGGIGKTLLAARVARDIAPAFEHVFWRSLRDAPTPGEWLAEAIGFLAPNDPARRRKSRLSSGGCWSCCARPAACWCWTTSRRCSSPAAAPGTIGRAMSGMARCSSRPPKSRTAAAWSSPAARSRRS